MVIAIAIVIAIVTDLVMDHVKSPAKLSVERRRFSRFDVQWLVQYSAEDKVMLGVAENISRGGMLVIGGPALLPGRDLEFKLRDGGGKILSVVGRVCGQKAAGVHVEFLAVAEGSIEETIEREIMPNLLEGLAGTDADASAVRLVSSWYREIGQYERALQVLRSLAAGAKSPEPYEELAQWLLIRSKRLLLSGGPELLHEAQQVIGQGLKVAASPVLVRLYQEGVRVGERLQQLQEEEHKRQLEDTSVSGEAILAEGLREPESDRRSAFFPSISSAAERDTDPDMSLPGGIDTDPNSRRFDVTAMDTKPNMLQPGDIDTVPNARRSHLAELESNAGYSADRPAPLPSFESRLTVVTNAIRKRVNWRWSAVGVLVFGLTIGLMFGLRAPENPTIDSSSEPVSELSVIPMDEQQYEDLLDLEPELLARPPESANKKPRPGKRQGRKPRRLTPASDDVLQGATETGAADVDRLASAKDHLEGRKVLLAIEELEALVADQPRNADAFRLLGIAYSLAGREERAIAAFERHVELEPDGKHAEKMRSIIEEYHNR
ncbi:MAG: hypothetical protein A2289_17765 [Deltaproteobacteria bacterium RIFOXYA12_FULL_58_15]|nr:MAG: hypothetical protein A2289_17765 [Deltaproteobacteria bacterium RIFOXYA12_FULL_58_15]OGR08353.1 MAG: hypothetical protein A2341_25135 [Deltaproteobacteria bacterium RIFOXYB12_FULL_58_9]